eukprot:COSAG01_NODE_43424_length_430_cov_0.567976_1_plen_54_part_10
MYVLSSEPQCPPAGFAFAGCNLNSRIAGDKPYVAVILSCTAEHVKTLPMHFVKS